MESWKLFIYLAFGNLLVLIVKATTESSSKELPSKKEIDYDFAKYSTEIPSTTDDLTKVSEDISQKEIASDSVNHSTEIPSSTDDATQVSQDLFEKQTDKDSVNYSTATDIPNISTTGDLTTGLEVVSMKDIDNNFETHNEGEDTRTEVSYAADDFTAVFEESPSDNDDSGFSKTDVTDDAETEDHNFLIYSAYVMAWLFGVLLIFMAAASLFCFLTGISGVFYWIYIGCRRIIRKCCCSKESELEYYGGDNWTLREAPIMKSF